MPPCTPRARCCRAWRAVRPDATLWLVGAAPRPEVRALAALPGVTVTGAVPSLAPALAAAHVMVAPLRFSSGIQNKILEAMAASLPIVTTTAVAEGVPGAGDLVSAADDADGLARATLALLADPAAAEARATRARAFARARFSWEALAGELERVVAESRGARA
jgi:glycosyltransferase involved in cell wall biosynthesis